MLHCFPLNSVTKTNASILAFSRFSKILNLLNIRNRSLAHVPTGLPHGRHRQMRREAASVFYSDPETVSRRSRKNLGFRRTTPFCKHTAQMQWQRAPTQAGLAWTGNADTHACCGKPPSGIFCGARPRVFTHCTIRHWRISCRAWNSLKPQPSPACWSIF